MEQIANGHKKDDLLQKLYPVFELSSLIRPRSLWIATVVQQPPILLGLLYNTEKDAVQYRLRFQTPTQPKSFRRTRWRKLIESSVLQRSAERIQQAFATMATQIGSSETVTLQFAPGASDAEILQILFSSLLPTLFNQA